MIPMSDLTFRTGVLFHSSAAPDDWATTLLGMLGFVLVAYVFVLWGRGGRG